VHMFLRRTRSSTRRLAQRYLADAAAPTIPGNLPQPEVFTDKEVERRDRKTRLAASFRLFSKFGFDEGAAGHITVRDPEHTG